MNEFYVGIPKEVRKAQQNGTSSYLRPMPGAARMYPETDVPLIYAKHYGEIELPELLEKKIERIAKKYSLGSDLAAYMVKGSKLELFEELATKYKGIKSAFIAETLGPSLVGLRREHNVDASTITNDEFRMVFKYLSEDKLHKDIFIDILIDLSKNRFNLVRYKSLGTEEIHKVIVDIVRKHQGAPFGALMGMSMKALGGKASGQVISAELKKIIQKGHK